MQNLNPEINQTRGASQVGNDGTGLPEMLGQVRRAMIRFITEAPQQGDYALMVLSMIGRSPTEGEQLMIQTYGERRAEAVAALDIIQQIAAEYERAMLTIQTLSDTELVKTLIASGEDFKNGRCVRLEDMDLLIETQQERDTLRERVETLETVITAVHDAAVEQKMAPVVDALRPFIIAAPTAKG